MTKTQAEVVERAEKALQAGRYRPGVRGGEKLIADLIALTKRLSEERDYYQERWLES